MICQNCRTAGDENSVAEYKRAAKYHKKCDDKGCVCQHKTGPGHTGPSGLRQTQSP